MAYILKVTIENTHPPVWRRIVVPEKISFRDLHEILQVIFDWDDAHMHDFTFPSSKIEIVQSGETGYGACAEEDTVAIDDFLLHYKWIRYTYDFGDEWRHKIVLEKTDAEDTKRYAQVLKYKGDNFIEDVGAWEEEEDELCYRSEFSMDKVNEILRKMEFAKMESKEEGERFSKGLQLEEMLKSLGKMLKSSPEKQREILLEMLQKMDIEEMFEREEVEDLSLREGMKMRFLDTLAIDGRDEEGFPICRLLLNFHEPVRTVKEMLDDLSLTEIQDYDKYLQLGEKELSKEEAMEAVSQAYLEHPEYLLEVFEQKELLELQKFFKIPSGRSYECKEVELIAKAISIGIMDVEASNVSGKNVIHVRFAKEVEQIMEKLGKQDINAYYQKLHERTEHIKSIVMTYSVIEIDEAVKQYRNFFEKNASETQLKRCMYWHFYFLENSQIIDLEDGASIIATLEMDVEQVLEDRETYGAVNLPYRQFSKKQLLVEGKCPNEFDSLWIDFYKSLREEYGLDEEDADFWLLEEYEAVQNGCSATELWLDLQDEFDFSELSVRTEYWALLTDICLNTPIPALKGYTRAEYAKMTGREPWQLGLFEQELVEEIEEEGCLFCLEPKVQYELFCTTTKEKNSAADVRKVKQMIADIPYESLDLEFLLFTTYLKNRQSEKAVHLLKKLYDKTKDGSLAELLRAFDMAKQEAASFYPWDDEYWEEDFDAEEVVTYKRENEKVGRNDPCPCGSGKKFKKCCLGKGIYD